MAVVVYDKVTGQIRVASEEQTPQLLTGEATIEIPTIMGVLLHQMVVIDGELTQNPNPPAPPPPNDIEQAISEMEAATTVAGVKGAVLRFMRARR